MSSFDPHRNLHTRQAEDRAKNTTWAWVIGGGVAILLFAGLYAMSGNGTYVASDTPRPQNNVTTPRTTGSAPQPDATSDQSSTRGSPASSPQSDVPPTMNVDPQTTK